MAIPSLPSTNGSLTTRAALASTLSESTDPFAERHLIEVATNMALAYLRQKARLGSLRPEYFGLSLEDLALDSTAELFQRDADGQYIELRAYFGSIDWTSMSNVEIDIALRRIVFSKVSEALYRRFRENDPNLGKVIRNIKDSARTSVGVRLERVDRKLWLVFGDEAPLAREKPVAPYEIVETYVTPALGQSGNTRDAISALAAFLDAHAHYRNGFPVSALGKIVRSAFIRLGASLADEDSSSASAYSSDEVSQAIDAATSAVGSKFLSTYVNKKKVDISTFRLYLRTVRDVLESQYVYDTSSTYSHFELMSAHEPDLSEREYRHRHRNRIEYMVKTARSHLAAFLSDQPVGTQTVS